MVLAYPIIYRPIEACFWPKTIGIFALSYMYICIAPRCNGHIFPFLGCFHICSAAVSSVLFLVGMSFLARSVFPIAPKIDSLSICYRLSFLSP